jgi:hypothetical protein
MEVDPLVYVDVMESYFRCPKINPRDGIYVAVGDDEYIVYFQERRDDMYIYRCVHPTRGWVFLSVSG